MSTLRIAALAAVAGALLPFATGGSAVAQQATANPLAAQSLEGLAATRDRPLFSAQRRPPAAPRFVAAPPPPPPPPAEPPQVAVYGIVAESNGARAMVRANGDKIIGVRVGDDIGGWKVTKIERRQIELSLADRAVSFAMFSANSATAASPAADDDDGQNGDPDNPDTTPRKRQSARD